MKIYRNRRATSGIEYALSIGLIAVLAIAALVFAGQSVRNLFVKTSNTLQGVGNFTSQAPAPGPAPDTTGPALTIFSPPSNATYSTGQNLDFIVTWNEAVLVTGTPRITLTIGTTTRYATYVSGTGSNALTFRHTVVSGDGDGDGITAISPIDLNGGSLADAASNAAGLAFSAPSMTGVLVSAGCTSGSQSFSTIGSALFTVPAGCNSLQIVANGASGAAAGYQAGGAGGRITGRLAVSAGQQLTVVVGDGGKYNSALPRGGSGGGGFSGVLTTGGTHLLTAGGGGGGSGYGDGFTSVVGIGGPGGGGGSGGAGICGTGGSAYAYDNSASPTGGNGGAGTAGAGFAGTSTGGGNGGDGCTDNAGGGGGGGYGVTAGIAGQTNQPGGNGGYGGGGGGGCAGSGANFWRAAGGGGGGGGYRGGSGGTNQSAGCTVERPAGGGGGGASYAAPGLTSSVVNTVGGGAVAGISNNNGFPGSVTISWP